MNAADQVFLCLGFFSLGFGLAMARRLDRKPALPPGVHLRVDIGDEDLADRYLTTLETTISDPVIRDRVQQAREAKR